MQAEAAEAKLSRLLMVEHRKEPSQRSGIIAGIMYWSARQVCACKDALRERACGAMTDALAGETSICAVLHRFVACCWARRDQISL